MTIWRPPIEQFPGPRYQAIADAIQRDIRSGRLRPGDRLPTHRDLAHALGVTVGTVTRGYAEAEKRGLARGHIGRGTYVADKDRKLSPFTIREEDGSWPVNCALALPLPGLNPDLGPLLDGIRRAPYLRRLLEYQPPQGAERFRETGARWLERFGIRCAPENVLVCNGGQHALTILFGGLLSGGDKVITEEATYPGVKGLADLFKLRLVPAATDRQGLIPDAVEAACRQDGVKAIYTMPTIHNPTTACLPESRRRELAEIARRHGLLIFEDDPYRLLREDPPPPVAVYAPERTFFPATITKILDGGARISFLASPPEYTARLGQVITVTTWMTPPLMAELAVRFVDSGLADETLARKREENAARNRLARSMLDGLDIQSHENAYFLWLHLPAQWRPRDFVRRARERGVEILPASDFTIGEARPQNAVRVALSAAPDRESLARGLAVLSGMARDWPALEPGIL